MEKMGIMRRTQKVMVVNRYMAGRERIVDKVSCLVDVEESCIDS